MASVCALATIGSARQSKAIRHGVKIFILILLLFFPSVFWQMWSEVRHVDGKPDREKPVLLAS
jgi:hypothetical protein